MCVGVYAVSDSCDVCGRIVRALQLYIIRFYEVHTRASARTHTPTTLVDKVLIFRPHKEFPMVWSIQTVLNGLVHTTVLNGFVHINSSQWFRPYKQFPMVSSIQTLPNGFVHTNISQWFRPYKHFTMVSFTQTLPNGF
jgi:hypothetical protein